MENVKVFSKKLGMSIQIAPQLAMNNGAQIRLFNDAWSRGEGHWANSDSWSRGTYWTNSDNWNRGTYWTNSDNWNRGTYWTNSSWSQNSSYWSNNSDGGK